LLIPCLSDNQEFPKCSRKVTENREAKFFLIHKIQ
jgi:hypothetical protein